jgi:hypothetical protein
METKSDPVKKRGRPRKINKQESESELDSSAKSETSPKPKTTEAQREASKKSYAKNQDDQRAKKLQYKHDHIDAIREQQNLRYQQIKNQLQLKRLSHTVFSEKFTDEQRIQLLEELNQWKITNSK